MPIGSGTGCVDARSISSLLGDRSDTFLRRASSGPTPGSHGTAGGGTRVTPGWPGPHTGGVPSASSVLAFAVASVVIVAIPGPSILFTIGRALSAGRRAALLTVLGNAGGILTQIVAIAVGLGPVVASSATAYTVLKLAGAAYLVWLGVQTFRARHTLAGSMTGALPPTRAAGAIRAGFLVGVTNPKSLVFFMALLPQFVDPARPVATQLLVLGGVFAVIALALDGSLALAASRFREWFASSPRRLARVGGAGGLMMVGLGAGLVVTGRSD